ncbi:MAG: Nif3-like dinuclear metal center hexameric protein [Planctomycetaceae bacterium]|nr:Nif3-like dinuclear metal center hexameric protein [Planctomycetaceae bacterium]
MTVDDCIKHLEEIAPTQLAEEWDNVGLLVGDRASSVQKVLTCLTLTPDVAREALEAEVDLIVTHHPVLFRGVKRLTTDNLEGAMLLALIHGGVAVYSPHTAYDSAHTGINQQLADGLKLIDIAPLRPVEASENPEAAIGGGRFGRLPIAMTLAELVDRVRTLMRAEGVSFVGDPQRSVERIAVACGSAAEFVPDAVRLGCDALVTGEARFHSCLEARESGLALVLPGHYATERPGVEWLAARLADEWASVDVWASRVERDPLQWSTT